MRGIIRSVKAEAIKKGKTMNASDFNTQVAKMGIRKNNTLTVGGFKITKWGANYFHLETTEGKYIGVAGLKWLAGKLADAGAIK